MSRVQIDNVCPHCRYQPDTATEVTALVEDKPSPMPEPGDVSLCIECAEWSVFNKDLRLRVPTDKELLDIGLNPDCRTLREAWARMQAEILTQALPQAPSSP